jgi:endoglucanase
LKSTKIKTEMKQISKLLVFSTLAIVFLLNQPVSIAQAPFTRGVNITGWLQTSGIRQVQFTRYTKKDFINIKSLGCDVIRLPMDLTAMTNGSPDYVIDPLFYMILDSAVTWAEDLQIHLILDNHTMDPGTNTDPAIGIMLQKIWVQMAEHYKDRSAYICYELRNEPHGITTAAWSTIQINLINAIRAIDTKHTIVVGASGWNTYSEMSKLPVFADTNLIYTFHFYDPFLFTHQGATWTSPSMGPLAGVPFPYDMAAMPACPTALKGTWIEGSLSTSYKTDGTVTRVKQLIDQAVTFKNTRNVKVFCGEFGVYDLNSDTTQRVFWYETVRNYLEEKGISWTIWDYHGGFGLYRKGTDGRFESDLNIPMVTALGLNVPEQHPFSIVPDSAAIPIYNDFVQANILGGASAGTGIADFFVTDTVHSGKYCIELSGVPQYSNIGFDFVPNRDFSFLRSDKYFLEFWVRGNVSSTQFDVRFIDTKTGPDDHPWRMRRTINKAIAPFDGQWHYVKLPLSTFTEHGSWDGTWFNPAGLFDWKAIDRMEIVAEQAALTGASLWFDDIAISKISLVSVPQNPASDAEEFQLKAWPNPVNSHTSISYRLETGSRTELELISISGSKICSLISKYQPAGNYAVPFQGMDGKGSPLKQGIYICRLTSFGSTQAIKLLVN